MNGERDVTKLISNMNPEIVPGEFVFCTFPLKEFSEEDAEYKMAFIEDEGMTIVMSKIQADILSIEYSQTWAQLTLNIHSGLEAVGFLAEILPHLSEVGIPTNVVSAFYHDHIFVPYELRHSALEVLARLSTSSKLLQ